MCYLKYVHGSDEKLVAYSSRTLTKVERNYSQLEKVVFSFSFWCEKVAAWANVLLLLVILPFWTLFLLRSDT